MPALTDKSLYSNKLYKTLSFLDAQEHKRFLRFLQSPYFNQSKTLVKLYSLLAKAQEKSVASFDRHDIWNRLSGSQSYDDVTFRKHCSDLHKLLEQFMSLEISQQEPMERYIDLMGFYARKKMEPLYPGVVRKVRNNLEQQPYTSLQNYWHRYRFERLYYQMMNYDVKLDLRANLESISNNLDVYYWIEKLKVYSAAISQRKTGTFEYSLQFVDEIVDYLSKYPVEEVPELAIYYYSYRMLDEEEETSHYFNYRRILERFGGEIPEEEATELYDAALHYCTGKINKGNQKFLEEYLDLFEDGIRKKIFFTNDELAPWRFNNVIGAALRLGKLKWAEQFIEAYAQYLPADSRENVYTFNLARVYRYQKEYDKVLHLLRNVEYEDTGYNLISKAMLIITYYELDEFDALDSFSESFRVFLNRQKNISAERRQSYLNLIKFVRKLIKVLPGDKPAIEKLRSELEANRSFTVNYDWLMEKTNELM